MLFNGDGFEVVVSLKKNKTGQPKEKGLLEVGFFLHFCYHR